MALRRRDRRPRNGHGAAADEGRGAPHPDGRDAAGDLVDLDPDEAGSANLLALCDLPAEGAVQLPAGVAQVASQHGGGRAGGRVLGHARSGREHAHPYIPAEERAHQVDVVRPRIREHVPPERQVEDGAAKGGDGAYRDHMKGEAAGHHGGGEGAGMIATQVGRVQTDHRGQLLRRMRRLAPLRQHRRGKLREHRAAAPVLHRCGHQADVFLEHQLGVSIPRPANGGPSPNRLRARQIDRGAHGRMPRERHLHLGGEDAHPRRPLRRLGRSQKHRFGQVHLARHLLHQLRRQMCRVREDAERVAAEGLLREDVEGSEVEFHVSRPMHQGLETTPTRRRTATLSYTPRGSP